MVAYIPESNSFSPLADEGYREPVYPLPEYGQKDRGEPRISGYPLVELAGRPRGGVFGIQDAPAPDRVVAEDERAGTREPQSPLQVLGIAFLVGVDEDDVEGSLVVLGHLRQQLARVADPDLDFVREPRP